MNILNEVLSLDKNGNSDGALKLLYSMIYDMQQDDISCDSLILEFLAHDFSALLFVGLARITKPYSKVLVNRPELLFKLKLKLHETCSYDEAENVYNTVA